jgi:hypothetical protein
MIFSKNKTTENYDLKLEYEIIIMCGDVYQNIIFFERKKERRKKEERDQKYRSISFKF